MNQADVFIDSVASLKDKLEVSHSLVAKSSLISKVLRHDLKMSYRKVKPISWFENSAKSKILRQQFALAFLDIDLEQKVVVSIDESWCGMSDFRRRKWRQHRHTNSVAQLAVAPRISMIAALDTKGEVWLSLLQANTNSDIMVLFFSHLILSLDKERPGWRRTHYWLLDNAPYHRSTKVLQFLEDYQVPVLYTGSYSYDAGK